MEEMKILARKDNKVEATCSGFIYAVKGLKTSRFSFATQIIRIEQRCCHFGPLRLSTLQQETSLVFIEIRGILRSAFIISIPASFPLLSLARHSKIATARNPSSR